ncbi:MAG: DUF4197 domain-containing protein [Desulfuromonas sp.]|uniref:DUF4197 domain-containing protein n=1 Tax=Desulfuromonas sp. TaxID=892 RepID=UPI000CA6EDA6|nr:DUF4197 domain-containing protein [Desulfuromonas sp.]PLX81825.1 MAG: DUF4197 domain-containing protein [Desulfuromonas sp.]
MTRQIGRESRRAFLLVLALVMICGPAAGAAGLDESLFRIRQGGGAETLDESTVASGLKDALRVGAERAVASTSQADGFWGNELIRIGLPQQLQPMAGALRATGLGGQVDALEMAMNRAAEQAAGEAKDVFWDAITGMTLADANAIYRGGDTAATDYFRGRTEKTLRDRFRPVVAEKMSGVGLYQLYNQLVGSYTALPFVSKPSLDLEGYVSDRALDGLFTVLAEEESLIRQNPLARSTDLLQKVFGR